MLNNLTNLASLLDTVITEPGEIDGSYIIWDPNIISQGLAQMKQWAGSAFNVAIWIFLLISGIYIVVSIVRSLAG